MTQPDHFPWEVKFQPLAPPDPDHTADTTDIPTSISGYAALFDVPDASGDIIRPGAFTRTLAERIARGPNRQPGVKLLWQHDPGQPIGLWTRLQEDPIGLRVEGTLLTRLRQGAEAAELLHAGAIDGLSIGFQTVKSQASKQGRILTELDLWEISLVTFPMAHGARLDNPMTTTMPTATHSLITALQHAASSFR